MLLDAKISEADTIDTGKGCRLCIRRGRRDLDHDEGRCVLGHPDGTMLEVVFCKQSAEVAWIDAIQRFSKE